MSQSFFFCIASGSAGQQLFQSAEMTEKAQIKTKMCVITTE